MLIRSTAFFGEKDNLVVTVLSAILLALVVWSVFISAVFLIGSHDFFARLSCQMMGYKEGKFVGLYQACFNPDTIDLRVCAGWLCLDRQFVQ